MKIKIIGDGPLRNELVYLFKDYSQNNILGSTVMKYQTYCNC